MPDVGFDLVGVLQHTHLQQLLAEVPLVDLVAQGGLVESLDVTQRELVGQQLEAERVVAEFSVEPLDGVGEDRVVVKRQLDPT